MTLIEILVVLVLIGIVMGIVGGNFIGQGETGQAQGGEDPDRTDQPDARSVQARDRPLSDLAGGAAALITAPAGVSNWNGPYWKQATVPKDPWGNEYQYVFPGQHGDYDLISNGPTGQQGGEGTNRAITSWDP